MLTIEEFIRLAADRGVKLEIVEVGGKRYMTNGAVAYPLVRRTWITPEMGNELCDLFRLPYLDFALDEHPED